jgi:tRNA dimethylallyltransferase
MSLQMNHKLPITREVLATRKPLIVILGPTAVGKTEISIQLAEMFGGEIISADSRLFFRGMDIGTAKPTVEERSRITHHLIDVTSLDDIWSLGKYKREAQRAIQIVYSHGNLPFLVGGTGQYIRAVTEGWTIPNVQPSPALREALEDWINEIGKQGLYQRLTYLDPIAAEKIDYRNLRRTIRAMEVILLTGKRFSEQRRRVASKYDVLQLGVIRSREELYERVDDRIDTMIRNGLVSEVEGLLAQGYDANLPTLSAIGYREMVSFLTGEIGLDEAIREIRRNTRILVRRQANWFKADDPNIHWFNVGEFTILKMRALIDQWLEKPSK